MFARVKGKKAERGLSATVEHLDRVHQEEIISLSKKTGIPEMYQNQAFMAMGGKQKKDKAFKKSNFM